jgi:NAD(P)-dependent dehydrogenase (short-subunit alcohol dehydrogenase family)
MSLVQDPAVAVEAEKQPPASRVAPKYGVDCRELAADLSGEDAVLTVEAIVKEYGYVDILVSNGDIARDTSYLEMAKSMGDEVPGVNFAGPIPVTRRVLGSRVEWVIGRTGPH